MVDGPTLTAESFADWLLVYGHDPEQDARLQAKAVLVDDHAALLARAEAAEKALRVAQHGLSVVRQHVNWHEVNEAVAAVDAALGSSPAAEAETCKCGSGSLMSGDHHAEGCPMWRAGGVSGSSEAVKDAYEPAKVAQGLLALWRWLRPAAAPCTCPYSISGRGWENDACPAHGKGKAAIT